MASGTEGLDDVLLRSEVDDVLRESFYQPVADIRPAAGRARAKKPKPDHYEVICISLYKEDLERLDAKVADLKSRGHRKMTRSGLIRFALDQVDVARMPRAY